MREDETHVAVKTFFCLVQVMNTSLLQEEDN